MFSCMSKQRMSCLGNSEGLNQEGLSICRRRLKSFFSGRGYSFCFDVTVAYGESLKHYIMQEKSEEEAIFSGIQFYFQLCWGQAFCLFGMSFILSFLITVDLHSFPL